MFGIASQTTMWDIKRFLEYSDKKLFTMKMVILKNCVLTEALKVFGERLTDWERNEIRKYPEIWFLGLEGNKVHARSNLPNNCGFDDENGSYNKVSYINQHFVRFFLSRV